jgi:hypothetical protein
MKGINNGGDYMGYFANSTDQMDYEEAFCHRCVNWNNQRLCSVMSIHFMYSYQLCNEHDHPGKIMMDMLIPEIDEGDGPYNGECTMFCLRAGQGG